MTIDRISGMGLLILAIYVAVETRVLPLGSHSNPGPGYLPLFLASFLAVLAVILIIQGRLSPLWKSVKWPEKVHALAIIGCSFFAAFAVEPLGYRASLFCHRGYGEGNEEGFSDYRP